jgi:sigma-E factor negative regulatory protein RseB
MAPAVSRWRAAALFALLASGPAAADDAMGWLARMEQALRELTYEGRFVYVEGSTVEALHLVHTARDGRERERLTSLNDAVREVLRDDDATTCIMPDIGTVSVGPRRPDRRGGVVRLEPDHVGEAYEARIDGRGRVAGRPAVFISLLPRDKMRYAYRLALDDATALPLRTELLDDAGVPLAQTLFVDLRVGPDARTPGLDVEASAAGGDAAVRQRAVSSMSEAPLPWAFTDVPRGFRLATATRRRLPGVTGEVHHVVFSDGVASVSIYIGAPDPQDLEGEAAVGPVNAFGARVGTFQATALGEVPPATLKALVGGLRAQPEARP